MTVYLFKPGYAIQRSSLLLVESICVAETAIVRSAEIQAEPLKPSPTGMEQITFAAANGIGYPYVIYPGQVVKYP